MDFLFFTSTIGLFGLAIGIVLVNFAPNPVGAQVGAVIVSISVLLLSIVAVNHLFV
jgi:hypothetical protein